MMMIGSDDGSQPSMDGFHDGEDNTDEVFIDFAELWSIMEEPDIKDEYPEGTVSGNRFEGLLDTEFWNDTGAEDRASQSASEIASASCEIAGTQSSKILAGNNDIHYAPQSFGSDVFAFSIKDEVADDERSCLSQMESCINVSEHVANPSLSNEMKDLFSYTASNDYNDTQNYGRIANGVIPVTFHNITTPCSDVGHDIVSRYHCRSPDEIGMSWPPTINVPPNAEKYDKCDVPGIELLSLLHSRVRSASSSLLHDQHHNMLASEHRLELLPFEIKAEGDYSVAGHEMPHQNPCYSANMNSQGVMVNSVQTFGIDNDDSDICILEDMSTPVSRNRVTVGVLTGAPKMAYDPDNQNSSYSRPKHNDERVIFRLAMEDLSKPRSEASLPDGFLSVPLLKHQRIALSWMANKETKGTCCSGGILADDQGLGKTISTIALILKERPPSSKLLKTDDWQTKAEMLNLEEDGLLHPTFHTGEGAEPCNFDGHPVNPDVTPQSKGRPSGGTLIVCPTSVLRQWSDELQSKVTSKADLSVVVYYGSNRSKDPCELAMYDVVITTYSIVSMEVPKQPVVGENVPQFGTPFNEMSSCRKRKSSGMCKQSKKGSNDDLISGPLAKVGWFRVVLDEAQSIKNYRTQTARACWGLRAKRRWCLSGTPIQNAIDDLYSYFRFLRHEPYAVFRIFSEQLKVPISKSPRNGYKKLQAVLRTIMLRRTKGSLIDGEPIINLPPKTIELRKIDFSNEERNFYNRLEAESKAQFAKFQASGTVKENYVNILLMLLRLRQACDHPLLVEGFNSRSNSSSIDTAKTLPQERQNFLLNCLEASLAICGICRDPPEDAVVTICGHVFCNQCISEHILGSDSQCPSKNCKTHISKLNVFSKTALRVALSDPRNVENTATTSGSEISPVFNPPSFSHPEDSSKVKVALELLLSLSQGDFSPSSTTEEKSSPNDCGKVQGGKAIVFSQWTRMLDLLEDCLKRSSIQYRRLDGTMPVATRDRGVKDFNRIPEVKVMIMSLKAASLGLNMVAASNVILLDLWWNPTTEDQAIDRAHRIGQTRPVSVFRLTVKDTVEDRILALQERKRKMVASAFGENERGSRQTRLTVEDLQYLFGS